MNLPPAPAQVAEDAALHRATNTRLQGHWLSLVRLAWVVLSVLALILFIASLPVYFASQQKSYTVGYAVFLLALGIFVALLIFWRKSEDWMALLVSFMLVLQGAGTTIYPFAVIPSFWQLPAFVMTLIALDLLCLVFCLFPTGRFVPRWIPWLV